MSFSDLNLSNALVEGLNKQKIKKPTVVQEQAIPEILAGKNLIIQSETGSGKTLAYLLPLCTKIQPNERGAHTLVLVPTHELAMQVHHQVQTLAQNSKLPFHSTTIVGNVNIKRQIDALKGKPQIIIGTPGRVLELIKKKKLSVHTVKTIVIDEMDKLLSKDNIDTVIAIIKSCLRDTQLLLFSASAPKGAQEVALTLKEQMTPLKVTQKITMPSNLTHLYVVVEKRDKIETVRKLAQCLQPKKAIIFIHNSYDVEETLTKLQHHHYSCASIHGQKDKKDRKKAIQDFHKGDLQYLIASDIVARGLHFENVPAVFHMSAPEDPIDYLHRAGRAGRGKSKGLSVLIITKNELPSIKAYQTAFGITLVECKLSGGKLINA